jgi:hypothetical protein
MAVHESARTTKLSSFTIAASTQRLIDYGIATGYLRGLRQM